MRRLLFALVLGLGLGSATVGAASAAYEGASGGAATPSVLTVGGGIDYSVTITGKAATVDLVLVLDNSGSMADPFGGGGSRWSALETASDSFVGELEAEGFFARGGKVGVVLFSTTAATGLAPTANVAAIQGAINGGAPAGGSCIGCGLQRATELLAAVPGSSTHRRIAYIVADGENNVEPPTVAEAVAGARAAGVERRVIGMGSEAENEGLEEFASSGTVAYPENGGQLTSAYKAQPTRLPGATGISWSFHLTPGFTASAPTASLGTVATSGGDVTWSVPSLGEGSATLTFHASHDPAAGCAATSLLSGTTFSDAEGDPAPAVAPGPLSISGCAPPAGSNSGGGTGGGGTKPSPPVTASSVILLPKPPATCSKRRSIRVRLSPPSGARIQSASVRVTGRKAKTYRGAQVRSALVINGLPSGRYRITVTVKLSTGRSLTLSQRYVGCPAPKA